MGICLPLTCKLCAYIIHLCAFKVICSESAILKMYQISYLLVINHL